MTDTLPSWGGWGRRRRWFGHFAEARARCRCRGAPGRRPPRPGWCSATACRQGARRPASGALPSRRRARHRPRATGRTSASAMAVPLLPRRCAGPVEARVAFEALLGRHPAVSWPPTVDALSSAHGGTAWSCARLSLPIILGPCRSRTTSIHRNQGTPIGITDESRRQRRRRRRPARGARGAVGRTGSGGSALAGQLHLGAQRHPQPLRRGRVHRPGRRTAAPHHVEYDVDHPECSASEDNGATVEIVLVGLAGCLTAGVAAVAQRARDRATGRHRHHRGPR